MNVWFKIALTGASVVAMSELIWWFRIAVCKVYDDSAIDNTLGAFVVLGLLLTFACGLIGVWA